MVRHGFLGRRAFVVEGSLPFIFNVSSRVAGPWDGPRLRLSSSVRCPAQSSARHRRHRRPDRGRGLLRPRAPCGCRAPTRPCRGRGEGSWRSSPASLVSFPFPPVTGRPDRARRPGAVGTGGPGRSAARFKRGVGREGSAPPPRHQRPEGGGDGGGRKGAPPRALSHRSAARWSRPARSSAARSPWARARSSRSVTSPSPARPLCPRAATAALAASSPPESQLRPQRGAKPQAMLAAGPGAARRTVGRTWRKGAAGGPSCRPLPAAGAEGGSDPTAAARRAADGAPTFSFILLRGKGSVVDGQGSGSCRRSEEVAAARGGSPGTEARELLPRRGNSLLG